MNIDQQIQAIDPIEQRLDETETRPDSPAWTAVVLTTEAGLESPCDRQEIWNWCLARVAALGKMQTPHARLVTLLHWTPANINLATDQAWESLRQMHCSLEDRKTTWEFLSGECLARLALEMPFETPGAKRQPVNLQVI